MIGRPSDDAASTQWLAALAGQPDVKADSWLNQQAAALRQALQQRSRRLDQAVPPADAALWRQLQFRLLREGLLQRRRGLKARLPCPLRSSTMR